MLASSAIVGVFIALLLYARTDRRRALEACVFLAPWQGLDVDIGLRVTAHLLAIAALIVVSFRDRRPAFPHGRHFDAVDLFAFAGVAVSLLHIPFLPKAEVLGGVARSPEIRAISQIVILLISLAVVWIAGCERFDYARLIRLGRVYVCSCLVLAVIGWWQIGVWYATGQSPLPIGSVDSVLGGRALARVASPVYLGAFPIHRMNSFGGEPKGLGQSLVIALLLMQVYWAVTCRRRTGVQKASWVTLAAAVAATQSTSAFYLYAVGIGVQVAVRRANPGQMNPRGRGFRRYAAAVVVCCLGGVVMARIGTDRGILALLRQRTADRGAFEDFDYAILRYLNANMSVALTGVGLGNIHLYADPYLDKDTRRYAENTPFVSKSGYLKLISELGLGGVIAFGSMCSTVLARLKRLCSAELSNGEAHVVCSLALEVGCLLTFAYLARVYMAPQFFLGLGIVLGVSRSHILPKPSHPTLACGRLAVFVRGADETRLLAKHS